MARKRNKARMIPRQQRRAERAKVLKRAAEIEADPHMRAEARRQADRRLIAMYSPYFDRTPISSLAWLWQQCNESPEFFPDNREALMSALAREYRDLTGRALNDDEAEGILFPETDRL